MTKISKEDIEDLDFVDRVELESVGTSIYRTGVSVTSTTSSTKRVIVSGALKGLSVPADVPSEIGDRITLSGNAAAGTYTIALIVSDVELEVVEPIVDSTGGLADFKHKVGALRVGYDPTGTPTAAQNVQEAITYALNNASGISTATHRGLLQLIHFIDQGPALGFITGATRSTIYSGALPTQLLWRRADTTKLVEKNLTYSGAFPTTIEWKLYDNDGVTVLETVTDTITYSGAFESSRTRAIS